MPPIRAPNQLALACVAAAGAARSWHEAFTVCSSEDAGDDEFIVWSSQEYAVLRENGAAGHLTPLATFLPNGRMELYPAGAALPFFTTRIDTDDVPQMPPA